MNKAITEGLQLMPPAFADGLDVWSSGDGTPGSDTYDGAANAVFVAADADFGGCLEMQKTENTQKLRFMGQTPLEPGCYLQIKVRIKAVSGALPAVRVAGWAGASGGSHIGGVSEYGMQYALTEYGKVLEVTGIVGSGERGGVEMVWGRDAAYGHFGLDLTGANGGVVRIDDIEITDITSAFHRKMLSVVDVTDYGAVGNGSTDCAAAFEAADAAADGRRILVPAGEFYLASTVSLNHETVFEGAVDMPDDQMLLLTKNFDFPSYAAAFGDEGLGFRKAFQALINNSDHESLDLMGRKISVTGPIDMAAAVPNKTSYATRRIIRNGQIEAADSAAWDSEAVTSQATYSASDARKLTNVANIANIAVGALVEGAGVGREVYVRSKNTGAGELTLSAPLYDAEGTQTFTFTDFKYLVDFSGFSSLSKFGVEGIEFQCNGRCSALRLAPSGSVFAVDSCFISRPKDRGITSIGTGCQGILIDNCQFLSHEDPLDVSDRVSIGLNVNNNDAKLRSNRATRFRHFAVLGGGNNTVTGNHFFQGDSVAGGVRTAGLVLTSNNCTSTVSDNYIDNCFIEWTNEWDPTPDFTGGFSFSALSVTANVFLSGDVAPWFSYIVIKPYGSGHYLNGLTVTGNKFRSLNGSIDRAERVDTSFSDLDFSRSKNVVFSGNMYHNVSIQSANPLRVLHGQSSASATWTVPAGGELPFQGHARYVDSVMALGPLQTSGNSTRYIAPYAEVLQGADSDEIRLRWQEAVKGEVQVLIRMDS
ncbi:right-handed parallel beta-helix repeat-containing protein [Leisingera aquaemixtae]|uniref:glycosyl hydrolase family 28-related protein n=1 Tax=Leisingera aquaemixtae TaxID=1396826 RepID=UPI001C975C5B|nr:glycosyl hydrolase family 28-related protein [Leisingera aquaemixtae]MBY6068792.1 right-handed parallel beta-helix repeat-containing protein [Leisingera aquaemixtae]